MAAVTVNTGPIEATSRAADVPREKWPALVRARATFALVKIPYDCRELLRFVQEAADLDMIGALGYADRDDFIRRGLEMDPEAVGLALSTLERVKPDWAMPYREAVALAGHGGKRVKGQGGHSTLKKQTASHWLLRLDRDHPELAAEVRAERMSANAAAIAAGFRERMVSIPAKPERMADVILRRHPEAARIIRERQ